MKIYIDADFKCYATQDGTLREFDVPFFDGKCPTLIEGYRYVPDSETWTREDGRVFSGEMICHWVDYNTLERAQFEYEHELLEQLKTQNAEYETALTEIEQALEV